MNYKDGETPISVVSFQKCRPEAFLIVDDGGRTGNDMGEYASLLAHAKRLGLKPLISRSKKMKLSAIFE